jgi:hypothetical protein
MADAMCQGRRRTLLGRGAIIVSWVVSFAVCYLLFLRQLSANSYLTEFWAGKFLPFPPRGLGDLAWLVMHSFELFARPGGMNAGTWGLAGLAGLCALVGLVSLAQSQWRLLIALILPLLVTLLASALQKYPFAGRLMLFSVPSLIILVAAGVIAIGQRLTRLPGVRGSLIVLILGPGVVESVRLVFIQPLHPEAAREAIREIWSHWDDGDWLFVSHGAMPTFAYYHDRFSFPPERVDFGADQRVSSSVVLTSRLKAFQGRSNVWILMCHFHDHHETQIRDILDSIGTCMHMSRRPDAVVMRYNLTQKTPQTSMLSCETSQSRLR